MRFMSVDLAAGATVGVPPAVLCVQGTPALLGGLIETLPARYRWVGGGAGDTMLAVVYDTDEVVVRGVAPGGLNPPVRTIVPSPDHPALAVRLFRPADLVSVICHCVAFGERPGSERLFCGNLLRGVAGYGEAVNVVVMGSVPQAARESLTGDGTLTDPLPPDAERTASLLVVPTIGVRSVQVDGGAATADLEIRHRNAVVNDRTWTQVGATVTERHWWYQPERSSGSRHGTHASAVRAGHRDTMGGGFTKLHYTLTNPDGTAVQAWTWADDANAGLETGARVVRASYEIDNRRGGTHTLDGPAEALKVGRAWDVPTVAELLTVTGPSGAEIALRGSDLALKADPGF